MNTGAAHGGHLAIVQLVLKDFGQLIDCFVRVAVFGTCSHCVAFHLH